MSTKLHAARFSLCLILLGFVVATTAFAGSAVVGSVAGSINATVGGQALLPNTVLFSGDSLQVRDGVAVVALESTNRMVFGRETAASFLRDSKEVTVLLDQGDVSLFHGEKSLPVRVKIGDVSVIPVAGFKTLGEVAVLNDTAVITAKEGTLRVEGAGQAIDVAKGKTITVKTKTSAPPQAGGAGTPPSGKHVSSLGAVEDTDLIVSAGALVFSIVDEIEASDAKSNASTAASNAAAATSQANAAISAANSAASAAQAAANAVGCALNASENNQGMASTYFPPAGESCNGVQ
jgi:hypothetical protein